MENMLFCEVTVNLTDLINVLLGLAGAVALIFLSVLFANLSSAIKKLKSMMDELALPISQTVNQLPEVVKKTDQSLGDVNKITESAATTVPEVLNDLSGVTKSVSQTVQTVADTATNVVDGVDNVVSGVKSGVGNFAKKVDFSGLISLVGKITGILAFIKKFKKKKSKNKR